MDITISINLHCVMSMSMYRLDQNQKSNNQKIEVSNWMKENFFNHKKRGTEVPRIIAQDYQKEYFRPALVP